MNMDLKDEIIQRVVKERLGEPNGIYKRHIHQDLVKEMMEQYYQSKVNNGVSDAVIKCDWKLERHERAKMELDYNKCMDCKKQIQ